MIAAERRHPVTLANAEFMAKVMRNATDPGGKGRVAVFAALPLLIMENQKGLVGRNARLGFKQVPKVAPGHEMVPGSNPVDDVRRSQIVLRCLPCHAFPGGMVRSVFHRVPVIRMLPTLFIRIRRRPAKTLAA